MDCFYLVTAYFKVKDFVGVDTALLDKSVTAYYDEEFPFGVVPMLSLGDARLADIYTDLSAVKSVDEFSE